MNKYTRLFIDESRLYVPGIAAILVRLREGRPEELDAREAQRLSHSIKGMALYEEQRAIAALTAAMERAFERLGADGGDGALLAPLDEAVPLLARMIDEVEEHGRTLADPAAHVLAIEGAL